MRPLDRRRDAHATGPCNDVLLRVHTCGEDLNWPGRCRGVRDSHFSIGGQGHRVVATGGRRPLCEVLVTADVGEEQVDAKPSGTRTQVPDGCGASGGECRASLASGVRSSGPHF